MLTRREFMVGAVAAGVLLYAKTSDAKPSQPATKVNFDVPPGTCDCHTHLQYPEKFPFYPGRIYTPEAALPEEMSRLHRALHIQRVVIVTPGCYGTDNSCTIYGMKARGKDARGIALIDDRTTERDMDALVKEGFKGIRLNLHRAGTHDPSVATRQFQNAAKRVKSRNWHVQLNTSLSVVAALKNEFAASPVPIVFDHFCKANTELGVNQPGFAELLDLVRSGRAYVKISITGAPRKDYTDFTPLAKALIAANPDRILWGTNWPHPNPVTPPGRKPTELTPLFQVDDGLTFNLLPVWEPNAEVRKKILVDNPAELFEF